MSAFTIPSRVFILAVIGGVILAALAGVVVSRTLAAEIKRNQAPGNDTRSAAQQAGAMVAYAPTKRYEVREIEGWTVLVNKTFLSKDAQLAQQTLTRLRQQLHQIVERVPAAAVKKLRTIHLWVEEKETEPPCMTYHPGSEWLRDHRKNPEKARCVELANARNFLKWTKEQPWMVLHEMSHGYHNQFLSEGFENPEIKNAYDSAIKSKRYELVTRINGRKEKAYATNNPMEFFAEASEAYFGKNDFYPFDRAELKRHDPETFALVDKLWHQE